MEGIAEIPFESFDWKMFEVEVTRYITLKEKASVFPLCGIATCSTCGLYEDIRLLQARIRLISNFLQGLKAHIKAITLLRRYLGEESWHSGKEVGIFHVYSERTGRTFLISTHGWCSELQNKSKGCRLIAKSREELLAVSFRCFMFEHPDHGVPGDAAVVSCLMLKHGTDKDIDEYLSRGKDNAIFLSKPFALSGSFVVLR